MTSVSQIDPRPLQEPAVRRATSADAAALAAIGADTFTETFAHLYRPQDLASFLAEAHSVERARADLADPAQAVWIAELGGQPVGYALAGPCGLPHPDVRPDDGELKRIYLKAAAQNVGLGGGLFDTALQWLLKDGARTIWIGVWSENYGAQRFYARRGFEKAGEYGFPVGESLDREFILRRRFE